MLEFRKINQNDIQLVFDWNTDSEARNNSFNSRMISIQEHKIWFNEKLNNPKAIYLIAMYFKQPVGLVRYDIKEHETIVGITISRDYRGRGLSSTLLIDSAKIYFSTYSIPLIAYIKAENIASKKAFEKANYTFIKAEEIQNQKALVYKKSKNDVPSA